MSDASDEAKAYLESFGCLAVGVAPLVLLVLGVVVCLGWWPALTWYLTEQGIP